ncbi:MAG: WYL domain-containing protein [Candidatus Gastranaerophilales bacterium]|nr:WYL domain-containing protein [Candidatus Gastranaerophilales bacterium]
MKKRIKKHDSCVRVLEFLKLLFRGNVELKEINNISDKFYQTIEAPETFLKYLSTIEVSGISVQKKGKQYTLSSNLTAISLKEREMDLLAEIYKGFNSSCAENSRKDFEAFLDILYKSLKPSVKTSLKKKIEAVKASCCDDLSKRAMFYQKYVDLGQKLVIKYRNEQYHAEPQSVEIENKNIYLNVYNNFSAENMKLLADEIESIQIVPLKNNATNLTTTVVFEVFEGLTYNYRLRENEKIQTFSNHNKVIINCGEDKNELIRRLLKYGENCKILAPQPFKEEFLKELEKVEVKYREFLK